MPQHNRTQDLAVAAAFPTIGLEELNVSAALQTRIDRKYVVPFRVAERVLGALEGSARVLRMNGLCGFAYNSVYFDTPERASFQAAATSRRRRYKIRTRSYLDSGTTFLEVKTEGARSATVKERINYHPRDRARLTPEGADYVMETLAQTLGTATMPDPHRLSPAIETDYRRTTLFLPASASRATIDEHLVWRIPGGDAARLEEVVIIETKSGSSPGALDRSLWSAGIRPSSVSKFATGLAALDPSLRSNKWHRTLTRGLVLSPAA